MHIEIILTNYLLKFMYGDQTFQDPLLLSREVLKKAYQDGLYYISSQKQVEKIIKEQALPHSFFLFAGLPSMEDISLTHTIKPLFNALKIELSYESLATFNLDSGLISDEVSFEDLQFKPVTLVLAFENHKPIYVEKEKSPHKEINFKQEEEQDMIIYFSHQLQEYVLAIQGKLLFLKQEWNKFFNSDLSLPYLENDQYLQYLKDCYEEIIYSDSIKK